MGRGTGDSVEAAVLLGAANRRFIRESRDYMGAGIEKMGLQWLHQHAYRAWALVAFRDRGVGYVVGVRGAGGARLRVSDEHGAIPQQDREVFRPGECRAQLVGAEGV